jgi:hypothetical protein
MKENISAFCGWSWWPGHFHCAKPPTWRAQHKEDCSIDRAYTLFCADHIDRMIAFWDGEECTPTKVPWPDLEACFEAATLNDAVLANSLALARLNKLSTEDAFKLAIVSLCDDRRLLLESLVERLKRA